MRNDLSHLIRNIPPRVIKQTIIIGENINPVQTQYIPPEETDEERWSREYDEENDPDPWSDLDECCCEGDCLDSVEDWELLGMDPESSQEEIDQMWENQM